MKEYIKSRIIMSLEVLALIPVSLMLTKATNIDTSALTFTLNTSNSLLQTVTSYTDLIGKEFPSPNHFVIPTEWLDKIQIVNANNAPWAKGTIVSDTTNKYTWCWNPATGTGTFKIIAK